MWKKIFPYPIQLLFISLQSQKKKIMSRQIEISYPETLAFSLKMRNTEFEREIKIISLVKLYELGKISSGIVLRS
jgi:hypothetical protein